MNISSSKHCTLQVSINMGVISSQEIRSFFFPVLSLVDRLSKYSLSL